MALLLCVSCAAPGALAQGTAATPDSTRTPLTIDEAVALAQHNNPDYLQTVTGRRAATASVRAARGALVPQLSATFTGQYQQGGQQLFNGVAFGATSDILQSSYNVGVTYQLNRATLLGPRQERATAEAVDADIAGARENLSAAVRQQYLTVLQSEARATLQDTLVENARVQLELARARAAVGSGTQLDVQRAEVALAQQQVQQLQGHNQVAIDRLRLFQQIGIPPAAGTPLSPTLPTDDAVPTLDALLAMGAARNPGVQALRARERAATVGVARARGEYFPTLTLSTGVGGYTYQYRDVNGLIDQQRAQLDAQRLSCVQLQEARAAAGLPNTLAACLALTLTDAEVAAIRARNDRFPFSFTTSPKSVVAQLSLPLFTGFAREQRVQEALVQREDAGYARRARELALTTEISTAYLTLQTARQTVALQEQNAARAKQELTLVQQQYAVGLTTFVDVTAARATYAQAENDRITAVYDYHKAFAALESAVGRPLR